MSDLDRYRARKDQFFQAHPQSPLTPEQKETFIGLNYFPENAALRLEVVVEPFPEQTPIEMQTSTGSTQTYIRFGRFTFMVEGKEAALTVFSDGHSFFLPFTDALAGSETYPAGRYLEPEETADGTLLVDFNLAYNPYCAITNSGRARSRRRRIDCACRSALVNASSSTSDPAIWPTLAGPLNGLCIEGPRRTMKAATQSCVADGGQNDVLSTRSNQWGCWQP